MIFFLSVFPLAYTEVARDVSKDTHTFHDDVAKKVINTSSPVKITAARGCSYAAGNKTSISFKKPIEVSVERDWLVSSVIFIDLVLLLHLRVNMATVYPSQFYFEMIDQILFT